MTDCTGRVVMALLYLLAAGAVWFMSQEALKALEEYQRRLLRRLPPEETTFDDFEDEDRKPEPEDCYGCGNDMPAEGPCIPCSTRAYGVGGDHFAWCNSIGCRKPPHCACNCKRPPETPKPAPVCTTCGKAKDEAPYCSNAFHFAPKPAPEAKGDAE